MIGVAMNGNTANIVASIIRSSPVTDLWLLNNQLTPPGVKLLADAILEAPNIDSLSIMQPQPEIMKVLLKTISTKKLNHLFVGMSNVEFPLEVIEFLADAKLFSGLNSLIIRSLTSASLLKLTSRLRNSSIMSLQISSSTFNETDILSLTQYLSFSNVKTLNLSFNNLTDESISILVPCLPALKIFELDVHGNSISEAGAIELVMGCLSNPGLKKIDLRNNNYECNTDYLKERLTTISSGVLQLVI
jgi:hypothetical protein